MRLTLALLPAALILVSCGDKSDLPPMVTSGSGDNNRAETLFQEGKSAEDAGKTKKAIGIYDRLADEIPFASKAPEARFRQAKLLDQSGETLKAFEAYQDVITRYSGSGLYKQAYDRQTEMAFQAAEGEIRTGGFLGLTSKLSPEKIIGMLEAVAKNAPRTDTAARAQYKIGDILVAQEKIGEAVEAYRKVVINYPNSSYAAEAQFRTGQVLMEQAREGNQDQANLARARDALNDYLTLFPGHRHNSEARQLLGNIGGQDVQNAFNIAQFYEKKGDTGSARFYYEEVVRRAKSGDLHDQAKARLAALGGN
ncbi:MAG: tetratricopeptide repeat protein [Akkermansiaceae bacterium]|jgi:TolA-binding protein|nr:tetratricopeptide repeat protein [Akkermansiaceae bacterium]